jgi:hypothetical protein
MWGRLKLTFSRYVPAHVGNPFGLARRMIFSGNAAALSTLFVTALGILCIPLDMLLSLRERRLITAAAATPARPVIFVCGPARSGTTLVFQVLCRHLDVSYLQNFTALFPRSPILVSKMYRRLFGLKRDSSDRYMNYYGKTSGLGGPSEANHIWNRWVQPDATGFRTILSAAGAQEAARFFAAFGEIDHKVVISKNNNMNVFADVVAAAMPNVLVICLRRSPEFLAQSLLQARRDIHGSVSHGYGVQNVEDAAAISDPMTSVASQVFYLNRKARELLSLVGANRFWIIDYEEFCRDPGKLVSDISKKLAVPMLTNSGPSTIPPIAIRNVVRDQAELERIRLRLRAAGGVE